MTQILLFINTHLAEFIDPNTSWIYTFEQTVPFSFSSLVDGLLQVYHHLRHRR